MLSNCERRVKPSFKMQKMWLLSLSLDKIFNMKKIFILLVLFLLGFVIGCANETDQELLIDNTTIHFRSGKDLDLIENSSKGIEFTKDDEVVATLSKSQKRFVGMDTIDFSLDSGKHAKITYEGDRWAYVIIDDKYTIINESMDKKNSDKMLKVIKSMTFECETVC